jgi:multiple sugar transport system substrate-binding protein
MSLKKKRLPGRPLRISAAVKPYFETLGVALLLLLLGACSQLPIPEWLATPAAPTGNVVSTATLPAPRPTGDDLSTPGQGPTSTSLPGPTTLRIWVPPQFLPGPDTAAGRLLQERLDEFTQRRLGVRIEVRPKAARGPGGLLDSLVTANAAASLALPDLVLLPRSEMETAALKGLLYPLNNLTSSLDEADWYPYSQQLAHLQDTSFGLPFAGDGLVLLYRPGEVDVALSDWEAVLSLDQPLVFPAADEQALFTLAQYLATGAPLQDGEGRPVLDAGALAEVLTFYQAAEAAEIMPFWLTQFSTDDQAWEAYHENRANLVVTWTARYLTQVPGDTAAAPIPAPGGTPFTLANGWVWALSSPQVERHSLSVELAEFLTQADFLARWTAAAGVLPPRASALAGWSNPALRSLVEGIVESARLIPPTDSLAVLSPLLHKATIDVLKEQADPLTAAQEAAESLANP